MEQHYYQAIFHSSGFGTLALVPSYFLVVVPVPLPYYRAISWWRYRKARIGSLRVRRGDEPQKTEEPE